VQPDSKLLAAASPRLVINKAWHILIDQACHGEQRACKAAAAADEMFGTKGT
jgi:hypothetical protein